MEAIHKPRLKSLSGILNLVLPGLGTMYAGFPERGFLIAAFTVTVVHFSTEFLFSLSPAGAVAAYGLFFVFAALVIADGIRCGIRFNREKRPPRRWGRWYFYILFALLFYGLGAGFVATSQRYIEQNFNIPSSSMEPNLKVNDGVVVRKYGYALSRGDVVVFRHPETQEFLIKRIIALPGDHISILFNEIYINGKLLKWQAAEHFKESPVPGTYVFWESTGPRSYRVVHNGMFPKNSTGDGFSFNGHWRGRGNPAFLDTDIPAEYVYLMGDNRDDSFDSRFLGPIPMSQIVGKAIYLYWPPQRFGIRL